MKSVAWKVLGVSAAVCSFVIVGAAQQKPADANDPRVGLKPGLKDAGVAARGMELVATRPRPEGFFDPENPAGLPMPGDTPANTTPRAPAPSPTAPQTGGPPPTAQGPQPYAPNSAARPGAGGLDFANSDVAFDGTHMVIGNFHGFNTYDIESAKNPRLLASVVCPGGQGDVSVYGNLLFMSVEQTRGRVDCGVQGVAEAISAERFRGVRIFDISDIRNPKQIAAVQTCRGSHTHTLVPKDKEVLYVYGSGTGGVRSGQELVDCSAGDPKENPNTALFRIEVIQVPLANPSQARIVSSPRIFENLTEAPSHGEAAEDKAEAKRMADSARAAGGFTAQIRTPRDTTDIVLGPNFVRIRLDSIVKARGGTGTPTAQDTATLRANMQQIVDLIVNPPNRAGPRPGPTQCHDITVYPAIGLAGGACGGYGLLLDIRDVTNPKRIGAAADSNFSFWHSATFNNDGTKILFTDEWGGGLQARCRPTDKPEWGANAIFTLVNNQMEFKSYYKLPAPQTRNENCVAHNGTLIPIPGRDVMAQGWYQGGVSVFDWTDPSRPVEIAYFDRGPMDSTKLVGAGSWSAYWYNGYIISSEIARGLDIFELTANPLLSQNEIDAAKLVRFDYLNAQDQQKLVWPASFVVARAYLDQLARSGGMPIARINATRDALSRAERASGQARIDALSQVSSQLNSDLATSSDQPKLRLLIAVVGDLAK